MKTTILLINSSWGQFLKKENALIFGAFSLLRSKISKNRLISFHCPQLGLISYLGTIKRGIATDLGSYFHCLNKRLK